MKSEEASFVQQNARVSRPERTQLDFLPRSIDEMVPPTRSEAAVERAARERQERTARAIEESEKARNFATRSLKTKTKRRFASARLIRMLVELEFATPPSSNMKANHPMT